MAVLTCHAMKFAGYVAWICSARNTLCTSFIKWTRGSKKQWKHTSNNCGPFWSGPF